MKESNDKGGLHPLFLPQKKSFTSAAFRVINIVYAEAYASFRCSELRKEALTIFPGCGHSDPVLGDGGFINRKENENHDF